MIIERILYNVIAITLLILLFGRMIIKNDNHYILLLIIEAIGLIIGFIETLAGKSISVFFTILEYFFSIIIPLAFIYYDKKGINLLEYFFAYLGKILSKLNCNNAALKVLTNLSKKYKNSYIAHKFLAEYYEKIGAERKAITEYVSAIEINKKDFNSYFVIAQMLNNISQKEEAIEMLNNLIRIKPDYLKASMLLGDLFLEKGQNKDAINIYLDAIKYNSADYNLHYHLAMAYALSNDFKSAEEEYKKAADINHFLYNTKFSLGQISLICEDEEKAEKYFNECLYGEEVEGYAYYELAKICIKKGEKDRAIAYIVKAIEINEELIIEFNKEDLFFGLKQYIKLPEKNKKGSKNTKKTFTKKEKLVYEHLKNMISVVGKLNNKTDYYKELYSKGEILRNQDKENTTYEEKNIW